MEPLQAIKKNQADQVENQKDDGVFLPRHFLFQGDATQSVDEPFQRSQKTMETGGFALVDPGHVGSEGSDEDQEYGKIQTYLKDSRDTHEKISGFSKASSR